MDFKVGLDFETYAGISLPDHGMDRYVGHPTFRPLIACGYQQDWAGQETEVAFDFVEDYYASARRKLDTYVHENGIIVAHNAAFEERVLRAMKIETRDLEFRDSAVVARAYGAGGKLEAAAPQLLDTDKYEPGRQLMRLFSIKGKYQEANDSLEFDPLVVEHHPAEWAEYKKYCGIDAKLGYQIDDLYGPLLSATEWDNYRITQEMNEVGWPVDIDMVHEMQRRYEQNQAEALAYFRTQYEKGVLEKDQLNFASFQQLKKWCEARGVKAKSFDEEHVARYLAVIRKRLVDHGNTMPDSKRIQLLEVEEMLTTKQILGGSSLKKLQAILNQVGDDGRLRGQYLHVGAGQTWRTSGRGVQLQNLKQLREVKDMDELDDEETVWSNEELARNLRQVFTASHPDGALIVGDFSSVESRGLAYKAGASWKLDAFRKGKDMYKVLAAKIDSCAYDAVTKDRRQFGKVGELSCGYQAAWKAVQAFAKKMGTDLSEQEARTLVSDWRDTNPEVVDLWDKYDKLLREVVGGQHTAVAGIGGGLEVEVASIPVPTSLRIQHPGVRSIRVTMYATNGEILVTRYFHGCYIRGNSICFYKPSEKKSGDLWSSHFRDPKTKEIRFYSIYGGKLTGILTQSLCREIFFRSLRMLRNRLANVPNVQIIGQFHDEIVLDWWPDPEGVTLENAKAILRVVMSSPGLLNGFPLEAEIKHDYRYTK